MLSLLPAEMDDEDYERRRSECLDEMLDLEKEFSEVKEKLFKERLSQVKAKLEDVMAGKASEYLDPLGVLQNHMQIRIEVAGIYRGFCLEVIHHKHRCELQGAQQHLESEKLLLFDTLQERLLERIQCLEDDRHSVGLTSEWWDDKLRPKHSSKEWDPLRPGKRKKAPLVSGPYIVYMLHEMDIMEDWTAIKKAKAAVSSPKRKLEGKSPVFSLFIARRRGCGPGSFNKVLIVPECLGGYRSPTEQWFKGRQPLSAWSIGEGYRARTPPPPVFVCVGCMSFHGIWCSLESWVLFCF
uniref:BRMS1 transcriptional repressor and anoikis regulator n=1 Tax=Podarcis muralis TaxID=64176 RepID=A0A670JGT2_PODMU